MKNPELMYIHDPMCSWCWGFRPALQQLLDTLPENVQVTRSLGGLAADSDDLMAEKMQERLQQTWKAIQQRIPGTEFNFDFWSRCTPRRSTYPSCRGVIAARQQGAKYDEEMTHAIQKGYYLEAKNPSDDSTLIELAQSIGLDPDKFEETLNSALTRQTLADEIELNRQMGAQQFPSLVLITGDATHQIKVDYTQPEVMLNSINQQLAT